MSQLSRSVKSLGERSIRPGSYSAVVTIARGTGRQALIEATAEVLRTGGDVQVSQIATDLGISHTLVYRHFPDGGREQLVAEAYAHLFRGFASADVEEFFRIISLGSIDTAELVALGERILGPRRKDVRAARLLALSASLANDQVAEYVERARRELVDDFIERLRAHDAGWSDEGATALAVLTLGIPLGIAAVGGRDLGRGERTALARMWADAILAALAARQ